MDALYPHTLPLIRKLESITTLSAEEKAALLRLPMQVRDMRPDQDLVREGDRPSQCCLVLEGFAATYKFAADGKRQILAFHIAGDIPDLQSLHIEVMDTNLGTISACKVAFIQHQHMQRPLQHSGFQTFVARRVLARNSNWTRPSGMMLTTRQTLPLSPK